MRARIQLLICVVTSLFCVQDQLAQAPDWQVDAEDYLYNMTATAQIYLDLSLVNTDGNLLAAFVEEEVRGVAVPVTLDDTVYYFLTVYSNVKSGDSVVFKVYLEDENAIYDALEVLVFQKDAIVGSIPSPYHINISLSGDFPIQLLPIPPDTTLDGIPFDSLLLQDFLLTYDNDPIAWSFLPGTNLNVSMSMNQQLAIEPVAPGWTGTDSVLIVATETGTVAAFSDSVTAWFTIAPNYLGPVFSNIPAQFPGDSMLADKDINDFLLYDGSCLHYDVDVLRFEDSIPMPVWIPPAPGAGAMNLVVRLSFNSLPFNGPGVLAGFVDDQLAGVATSVSADGSIYYFLSLADIASGTIELRFYDSELQYLYTLPTGIPFSAGSSVGDVNDPIAVELSPLVITISDQGIWSAMIIDSSFSGIVIAEFRVYDCDYPSKNDTIQVPFVLNQCPMQSWDICPGEGICATADSSLISVVWYKDDQPVYDKEVLSIFQPGFYHYEGIHSDSSSVLSCPLYVQEGQGCNGDFPMINVQSELFSLTIDNYPSITDATVEVNPFDVEWNGNGGNTFWNDPANWQFGIVPNVCQHAIIPDSLQVIVPSGTAARIWRLTVRSGANLTVNDSDALHILGN